MQGASRGVVDVQIMMMYDVMKCYHCSKDSSSAWLPFQKKKVKVLTNHIEARFD